MALQSDLRELIELLIEKNVEFLVVGAYAVAFRGFSRLTGCGFTFTQEQLS